MKLLRSLPLSFLSPACLLQSFMRSCCFFCASEGAFCAFPAFFSAAGGAFFSAILPFSWANAPGAAKAMKQIAAISFFMNMLP